MCVCVCVCVCYTLNHIRLLVTSWTVACQVPLSMDFSRQEYWSGLLFPSPGALPNSGIKPRSPALQAELYRLSHQGSHTYIWEVIYIYTYVHTKVIFIISVPNLERKKKVKLNSFDCLSPLVTNLMVSIPRSA